MNYRIIKILSALLCVFLFVSTLEAIAQSVGKTANLQGRWTWKRGSQEFELRLEQDGNKLTGYHIAIGQNGNKVDEADPAREPSVVGEVKGKTAKVKFKSGFPDSEGSGEATLNLHRQRLYWRITTSNGEHYLPVSAVLRRVN